MYPGPGPAVSVALDLSSLTSALCKLEIYHRGERDQTYITIEALPLLLLLVPPGRHQPERAYIDSDCLWSLEESFVEVDDKY